MKTLSYSFLSIIILVFSPSVFAAYYWSAYQSNSYKSGTAAGSLELYRQSLEGGSCNVEATLTGITYTGDNKATGSYTTYYNCNGNTGTASFNTWRTAYTPPTCDEGQIYNEETMACEAPPQDLCFDDVVTGERVCEWIDPDENPDGCVTAEGVTMCLDDLTDTDDPNSECKIIDGKRICDSDDDNKICGPKNGSYQCLSHEDNNNCGYFNGQLVCIDQNNQPIPDDSPDHPKNGGNSDGDETNDATDARDPTEGGDPDNQPGKQAADFEGVASEKTLRDISETLNEIGETLKDKGEECPEGEVCEDDSLSFNGEEIAFEIGDGVSELQAALSEYDAVIDNIRSQFSSSFGSFTGGGTLSDNNISIKGVDINNGLSKWAPYLSILASVILFAAAFISLGIVMGAKD